MSGIQIKLLHLCKEPLLLVLCLFSSFLFGSSSSDSGTHPIGVAPIAATGTITGMVADKDGNPYPNTRILATKGSETSTGDTDASGLYSISTKSTGIYKVAIELPLSAKIIGNAEPKVSVTANGTSRVDFTLEIQSLNAEPIFGAADVLRELRDKHGHTPLNEDEALYAANVFDQPLGLLTPIKSPFGEAVSFGEWKTAGGTLNASCNGNQSSVTISLQGMIPHGTYSFWLNFLNKPIKFGEPVNFGADLVAIQPLGASSGKENIAIANSQGTISAMVKHDSCILTREKGLVLVVVYHINGKTFGPNHIPDPEEASQLLVYFQ